LKFFYWGIPAFWFPSLFLFHFLFLLSLLPPFSCCFSHQFYSFSFFATTWAAVFPASAFLFFPPPPFPDPCFSLFAFPGVFSRISVFIYHPLLLNYRPFFTRQPAIFTYRQLPPFPPPKSALFPSPFLPPSNHVAPPHGVVFSPRGTFTLIGCRAPFFSDCTNSPAFQHLVF